MDLDLTKDLSYKILVERMGFTFFVDIEYEKIPEFWSYCSCIGHSVTNCNRKEVNHGKGKDSIAKHDKFVFVLQVKRLLQGQYSRDWWNFTQR